MYHSPIQIAVDDSAKDRLPEEWRTGTSLNVLTASLLFPHLQAAAEAYEPFVGDLESHALAIQYGLWQLLDL